MLDIDLLSMMNEELLAESWSIELGDYIIDIAWSPEGSKLAAATVEGSVFLIDDRGDSAHYELIGQHAGGANSLSWRHDGRELATAGHDGLVKCWDAESGQLLSEFMRATRGLPRQCTIPVAMCWRRLRVGISKFGTTSARLFTSPLNTRARSPI